MLDQHQPAAVTTPSLVVLSQNRLVSVENGVGLSRPAGYRGKYRSVHIPRADLFTSPTALIATALLQLTYVCHCVHKELGTYVLALTHNVRHRADWHRFILA